MKLVAVSIVKNEADIIEAFVRHTRAWVDLHLVFDHDSTDGTREILAALAREGLPVVLFTDDALANLQHVRSNHLARLAFTEHQADWVLPLDADEFICGLNRSALEAALGTPESQPATWEMRNYVPSDADDLREPNPVLRLRHRRPAASSTVKLIIPRGIGLDPGVAAGKGNHVLYRGPVALPSRALADGWLAHFSLRSPHQQALRVLTAELQKLARGQAHAGLDVHYRLGFQLLAEDPEKFFSVVLEPAARLLQEPVAYQGGALRHSLALTDLARTARALVPFLERLALSHGRLGVAGPAAIEPERENPIRRLDVSQVPALPHARADAFTGFTPRSGWEGKEGPVAEAFLPEFHWACGPETHLTVHAGKSHPARLEAEALTYAENQVTTVLAVSPGEPEGEPRHSPPAAGRGKRVGAPPHRVDRKRPGSAQAGAHLPRPAGDRGRTVTALGTVV